VGSRLFFTFHELFSNGQYHKEDFALGLTDKNRSPFAYSGIGAFLFSIGVENRIFGFLGYNSVSRDMLFVLVIPIKLHDQSIYQG